MTRETFLENASSRIATPVAEGYLLYTKNVCQLVKKMPDGNEDIVKFRNLEDAYERAFVDSVPLREVIETADENDMFGGGTCDDFDLFFPRD